MATKTPPIGSTEAAAVLGVSRSTVNRWADLGKLVPVFKCEGKRGARFFNRSEIERFKRELEQNRNAA